MCPMLLACIEMFCLGFRATPNRQPIGGWRHDIAGDFVRFSIAIEFEDASASAHGRRAGGRGVAGSLIRSRDFPSRIQILPSIITLNHRPHEAPVVSMF